VKIEMFSNISAPNLSNRQALGLTAFASVIATTSVILSYQALRREHRTERLKRQVGEDVERWEHSRAGSGFGTPEERAERRAEGDRVDGEWKVREWKKGEFDEGLIREQVGFESLSHKLIRELMIS
jgi:hypothetical protein